MSNLGIFQFQKLAKKVSIQFAEDTMNQIGLTTMAIHAPEELQKLLNKVPDMKRSAEAAGKDTEGTMSNGYSPPPGKKGIMDFVRKHGTGL